MDDMERIRQSLDQMQAEIERQQTAIQVSEKALGSYKPKGQKKLLRKLRRSLKK